LSPLKITTMKKGIYTLIGFLLFIMGGTALVLSLVGLKLSYLLWIDAAGGLVGFMIRIIMMISGIVIAVLNTGNWREDEELVDDKKQ
jgi:hypothetical protein